MKGQRPRSLGIQSEQGMVSPPAVQMNEKGMKIDKSKEYIRDGQWVEEVIQRLEGLGLLTML